MGGLLGGRASIPGCRVILPVGASISGLAYRTETGAEQKPRTEKEWKKRSAQERQERQERQDAVGMECQSVGL